jgi:uncharacterized RDD family membrane protein YckC
MDFKTTTRLKRLLAFLIDLLIFIPILATQFFLTHIGYYFQILGELIVVLFGIWYFVIYVYKHEYTFGKRYENIRIVSYRGSRISLKQAIIRYLAYSFLGLIQSIFFIYCILATSSDGYGELGFMDKIDFVYIQYEPVFSYLSYIEYAYILVYGLALVFDKERRSIADYVAGTIVVQN